MDRKLCAVNAKLRAQAMAARPRVKKIRRALVQVDREIANYIRAIAKGDFSSLEQALAAAERRRATLQAELAQLDGSQQPAVVQLTPVRLERHLQGMTEKLRSGMTGRVGEAIQQSIARNLVGVDGTLTIKPKPDGLPGVEESLGLLGCREGRTPIEQNTISAAGRQWKLIIAP